MSLVLDNSLGTPSNFGMGALTTWIRRGDLLLDPPFQRGSVWTPQQQEAWIISMLDGLPLPALFINRPETNEPMVCIDGRQRLEAIIAFEDDKLQVRGERFSEQNERFLRKWGFMALPTIFTAFEAERECIELYVRLLTTGTAHTPDEISAARKLLNAADRSDT